MSYKQYPQQTGPYIVKTKSEQSTHNWQDFDIARLQISVGQDYHEGEKIEATANWCIPRFKGIELCVNDTLQRYNLTFETGLPLNETMIATENKGKEWASRNIDLFESAETLDVFFWNDWLNNPHFDSTHEQVKRLYKNNIKFRQAIETNISDIWTRRQKKDMSVYSDNRFSEFHRLSLAYLLEEVAVFCLMYERREAIDVYPGSPIFTQGTFVEKPVIEAPAGLSMRKFCRIDFSRRSLAPEPEHTKLKFGS